MQTIFLKAPNIVQPLFTDRVFKRKPLELLPKTDRWRKQADLINLSSEARIKLEWLIFYETAGQHNVYATAHHFSITPKTVYKWLRRFDNGHVDRLEERSRAPNHVRQWEVTLIEEARIKKLRTQHLHWGKNKLKTRYATVYGQNISAWKIERVIRKHQLYPNQTKADQIAHRQKKARANPKLKIKDLTIEPRLWFLIHIDTIILYVGKVKRYIITACDHTGKFGYARMYATKSSRSAQDFLYRLYYLIEHDPKFGPINIQTDNGSEFEGEFDQALTQMAIPHWYSRVATPKDNSIVERFNQTLEYEWLYDGHSHSETDRFNKELTDWLVEYNFVRPHQSLDYLTPMAYVQNQLEHTRQINQSLLPMWSARTDSSHPCYSVIYLGRGAYAENITTTQSTKDCPYHQSHLAQMASSWSPSSRQSSAW